jgi:hypothetical protein
VARANALVIRVETIFEVVIEAGVAGKKPGQDKRLEKPRRVREVPFCGAGIVHCLNDLIFIAQWLGEVIG